MEDTGHTHWPRTVIMTTLVVQVIYSSQRGYYAHFTDEKSEV